MPLCKECKKSYSFHHHPPSSSFHTFDSPLPPCKFPPHSPFPMGGHDNTKGHKRMQLFCEAVAIGRGGVSDPHPAFFLPIATTSNKIFESEAIVNEKCRCWECRGEGNKTGLLCSLSAFPSFIKPGTRQTGLTGRFQKSFDMNNWHLLRKGEKLQRKREREKDSRVNDW